MVSLESRISKIEQSASYIDLNGMTDEELHAHAATFPMFSKGMYAAVLTLVGRYPSEFQVVKDDPERDEP